MNLIQYNSHESMNKLKYSANITSKNTRHGIVDYYLVQSSVGSESHEDESFCTREPQNFKKKENDRTGSLTL